MLGPLLFLLYINDVTDIFGGTFHLFLDSGGVKIQAGDFREHFSAV